MKTTTFRAAALLALLAGALPGQGAVLPALPGYVPAHLAIQPGTYRQTGRHRHAPAYRFEPLPGQSYYQLSRQAAPGQRFELQGFAFFVGLPCAPATLRLTVLLEDIHGPDDIAAYADFVQVHGQGSGFQVLTLRADKGNPQGDAGFFSLAQLPDSAQAAAVGCSLLQGYSLGEVVETYARSAR